MVVLVYAHKPPLKLEASIELEIQTPTREESKRWRKSLEIQYKVGFINDGTRLSTTSHQRKANVSLQNTT
jgi:hypothetical protein